MGTGWRRAFCTTIPRDSDSSPISEKHQRSPSPRSCTRLGFLSGGSVNSSNPSTPRLQSQSQPQTTPSVSTLRCRTTSEAAQTPIVNESPRLYCETTPKTAKSPRAKLASNPSSPRSPLKLSLFKNSFKFRSNCGICLSSVRTGQGTAIYTAECSHAFHFPCIAAHVRKHGTLVCPVCNAIWKDVPLLAIHKNLPTETGEPNDIGLINNQKEQNVAEKKMPDNSPRAVKPKRVEQQVQIIQKHSSDSIHPYDDDEPLLSPTSGSRIIPIPEAAEENEDEDDVEEFQGFFVNAKTKSSSDDFQFNGNDSRNVQMRLLPECAVVSGTRSHESYAIVLKVKAPPPPPKSRSGRNTTVPGLDLSHRAPIDLVTVLDVSGSMTGSKLHMLKRAMRLVISSLGSADRLSIVAFSAAPKRLLPLRRMTDQGQLAARRIVDRLVCGQGTSVGDALRKATKVLEDRRERNPVASVMLLSDGQDDRVQNQSDSSQRISSSRVSSTRFAHIEIPVHAFGFGEKGGHTPEPGEDAFAKCVGGLLSVVVQDLRIQLGFPSGSAQAEISAIYSCSGRPAVLNSSCVRLGDLYAEEERELLLELRVPATALGTRQVMTVRCLYKDPATQEVVSGKEQVLLVPPPQIVRSSGARTERLRNLFIATRAIAESRRLTENNDFTSAHHLLSSARALLMQSNTASAEEYVRGLGTELAELHWRRQHHQVEQLAGSQQRRRGGNEREPVLVDENGDPLTPSSAWRAAGKLAKVAIMKESLNRVGDLHGFENARF